MSAPPPPPSLPTAAPGTAAGEAAAPPPPPPPAHLAGRRQVVGLTCPSCAGTLEVDEGLRVVGCPFCDTPLLVTGEAGVRRFAVASEIDDERARAAAGGWLGRGWHKDPALRREAKLGEAFLCFLPFFRFRADVVGYAFGTEERRRTVGSGKNRRTETYEVDVERQTERSFDRTFAALNVAEWGVQMVNLAGDRLLPFEPGELERAGMVFPPTGSEAAVRASARQAFLTEGDPGRGLKRVRFRFVEAVRERLTVVYYPLWVVRYRFRDRSYQVVVDGEDGSLAYGKAPGNDLYRAVMLVTAEAAACFLGTSILQYGLVDSDEPLGVLAFAGGVAFAILAWGWSKFRYGGVVEEGSGLVQRPGAAAATLKKLFGRR